MKAKTVIYKKKVYLYTSINRVPVRISTGIDANQLTQQGLLSKTSGVMDVEEKNKTILKALSKLQDILNNNPSATAKEVTDLYTAPEATESINPKPVPQPLPVVKDSLTVIDAFKKFIADSESGERLSEKGTRLEKDTIKPYKNLLTNLLKYQLKYTLTWDSIRSPKFYNSFCNFYWNILDCFDNYTGSQVKTLKCFIKWCHTSKIITEPVDTAHYRVWKEDIEILVLYKDEIKLLYNMPIQCGNKETQEKLIRTRDTFLLGIFTCFRVQHLLNLTEEDLTIKNGDYYINTVVQKTKKIIQIKLNPIGVGIIQKYRYQFKTLLPPISEQKFNENLKDLARYFKGYLSNLKASGVKINLIGNNWDSNFRRIRYKRGIPEFHPVAPEDFISSHTMRRTGITFLLMAGLSQYEVCAISGHSLNSKEFIKYVKLAASIIEIKSVNAWKSVLM